MNLKQISIREAIEDFSNQYQEVKKFRKVILALCLDVVRNYKLLEVLRIQFQLDLLKLNLHNKYLLRVLAYEVTSRKLVDRIEKFQDF